MDKKKLKRRTNVLYRLRRWGGVKCVTREATIYLEYGQDPDAILQVKQLRDEFNFVIQYEIPS